MIVQMPTLSRKLAKDDLSVQQPIVVSTGIEQQATQSPVVEQIMVWQIPTMPLHLEVNDDVSILQTVPIQTVKRKRTVNKLRTLFVTVALLLVSILFLGTLAAIIVVVPSPAYKAEILIVLLIVLSYATSVQMKRIDRARRQVYLNMTQFVRTAK